MDQARLDRIARTLGATTTRRAGIAAALAAAFAAGQDDARGKKKNKTCKPTCANGFSCVKKRCVCKTEVECGDACCAAGQYCNASGACVPIPTDCTVCASGCPYATIGAALANDRGPTITVAPGRYDETDLAIDRDVTIEACAPAGRTPNVIVDARGEGRVFTVGFDRTATLRGIAVTGGQSSMAGGCISSFGTLTLQRCIVSFCESTNAGGAISSGTGSLTLDNTTVSGSVASDQAFGGGIVAGGEVRIVNGSRVDANRAGSSGGGIHFIGTTLLIQDSAVSGNQLTAQFALGGGVYVGMGTATLDNAPIIGNVVESGAGGGVHVAPDAALALRGATQVTGNATDASDGQGIRVDDRVTVTCEPGPRVCGNPESGATLASNCFAASGAAFPAACGCAAGACPD